MVILVRFVCTDSSWSQLLVTGTEAGKSKWNQAIKEVFTEEMAFDLSL